MPMNIKKGCLNMDFCVLAQKVKYLFVSSIKTSIDAEPKRICLEVESNVKSIKLLNYLFCPKNSKFHLQTSVCALDIILVMCINVGMVIVSSDVLCTMVLRICRRQYTVALLMKVSKDELGAAGSLSK